MNADKTIPPAQQIKRVLSIHPVGILPCNQSGTSNENIARVIGSPIISRFHQ
jgi:hypothetical protein